MDSDFYFSSVSGHIFAQHLFEDSWWILMNLDLYLTECEGNFVFLKAVVSNCKTTLAHY